MATKKMTATDSNIKRAFQQLHDAAIASLPRPHGLGVAIGFVTAALLLTKQLLDVGRLNAATEGALRKAVDDAVANGKLAIVQHSASGAVPPDPTESNYRHLRNCFGHGNWSYDEKTITPTSMKIKLEDFDPRRPEGQDKTWEATIELPDLVNLAERLLVETFNGLP